MLSTLQDYRHSPRAGPTEMKWKISSPSNGAQANFSLLSEKAMSFYNNWLMQAKSLSFPYT